MCPKMFRPTKKHSFKKMGFLLLAGFLLIYGIHLYFFQFRPVLLSLAKSQAHTLAVQSVNRSVREVVQETGYEDLISVMTDDNKRVTALMSNIVTMNRLKAELIAQIDKSIQQIDTFAVRIPLGSVFGIDVLSGFGPRMEIGMLSSGITEVDFINQFSDAGINQTLHRIQLEVKTSIQILIPHYHQVSAVVKTQIPIAETVVVGEVPESYTNLETEEGKLRDDILEVQ